MSSDNFRTIQQTRDELKRWAKHYGKSHLRSISLEQKEVDESAMYYVAPKESKIKNNRGKYSKNRDYRKACKGTLLPYTAQAKEKRQHTGPTIEKSIPTEIVSLEVFITTLPNNCKKALKDKYVLGLTVEGHWILKAETLVMRRR